LHPELPEQARFSAEITNIDVATNVEISDFLIDNNLRAGRVPPANIALHPVNIEIEDTDGGEEITVTMSYANTGLTDAEAAFYEVVFRPITAPEPTIGFQFFLGSVLDTDADTITSVLQPTDPASHITGLVGSPTGINGQYSLGCNDGFAGGGGGGLVRPGLVVNALAGIGAVFGAGGGAGPPGPTLTLGAIAQSDSGSETISLPQEIRYAVNNYDSYTPLGSIIDIYEDFDLPLSINGNGFALIGYENTLERQTIQPGESPELRLSFHALITRSEFDHCISSENVIENVTTLFRSPSLFIEPVADAIFPFGSIISTGLSL